MKYKWVNDFIGYFSSFIGSYSKFSILTNQKEKEKEKERNN
jgi:hypothetical protein